MQGQKSHSSKLFLWKNIFVLGAIFCAVFLGLTFNSHQVSALFVPTLSASIDQANLQVNGNQVINSTDKTTEIPLNLIVNTNNKTGYTATLNSETDETALVNSDSTNGAKINSISSTGLLGDFSENTWGVRIGDNTNFLPIPKLTSPMSVIQTTNKTNGDEMNNLEIGLKLGDNLESGNYNNRLIFSILTNNYERIALMTEGSDFNAKLKALETTTNKIEHFKKSSTAPTTAMNAINIDDENSDYEIKLWLDATDKTAYYYAKTDKVYLNLNSGNMFNYMNNLISLDLSSFDTSKVTYMYGMFFAMFSLTSLNLSNFDTSNVTDMNNMFYSMDNITTLNLSNFDTSNVTDMSGMFKYMSSLTSLDLSSFDTSRVTNMRDMFSYMYNLTSLDLSSFNTSNVANMGGMFSYVFKLTSLNLSNFDTSNVTDMNNMFSRMSSLISLDLSNFDTSKVTNMRDVFMGMHNLTSLNISSFDTSNVTDMRNMFYDVLSLTSLNLSNFDTSNVTDMEYIFAISDENRYSDKLEKIYVNNDFDTSKLVNYSEMFKDRKKLRGGNGSYLNNPGAADKSWLRIDDPANSRPGYFTRKP